MPGDPTQRLKKRALPQVGKFRLGSVLTGALAAVVMSMPYPETFGMLRWFDDVIDGYLAYANGTPTINLYIDSTSGSDANTGLSSGQAVKTIVRLMAVYAAQASATQILAINVKRDGLARANTTATGGTGATESAPKGLAIGGLFNGERVIVRAYGTTGAVPIITCFNTVAAGSWSKTATYTNIYEASITNTVAWVRRAGSWGGADTMVKMDGSGTTATNLTAMDAVAQESWYWDSGTNKLYIRVVAPIDPTTGALYEYVSSNTTEGIIVGDPAQVLNPAWVRIENVVIEGFGAKAAYDIGVAQDGIHSYIFGNSVLAVVGSTVVYNNRHNIVSGGTLVIDGSYVGCCTADGGSIVGYQAGGGQNCLVRGTVSTAGVLYRQAQKAQPSDFILTHTDGGGGHYNNLAISLRCSEWTGPCQSGCPLAASNPPPITTSADVRSFCVDYVKVVRDPSPFDATNPWGNAQSYNQPILPRDGGGCLYINCVMDACMPTGGDPTGATFGGWQLSTATPPGTLTNFAYNCIFRVDGSKAPFTTHLTGNATISFGAGAIGIRMWNCLSVWKPGATNHVYMFNQYANGAPVGVLCASIFAGAPSFQSNGADVRLAFNNNAANLKGNAYANLTNRTDSSNGYSNDANAIELLTVPSGPSDGAALQRAILSSDNPFGRPLEYDILRNARRTDLMTVGPWEAA